MRWLAQDEKMYWNNIKPNNGRNFQNTKLSATDLKNTIFFHVCCYGFAHGWKSLHETVVYMMKWFISLKYDIFHDVWYRQSAADTSLDFRTTRSSWWMNGEGFTNLNPRPFFGIFCYCVDMRNKILHGCLSIWNFSSRGQLDISFVRCAQS